LGKCHDADTHHPLRRTQAHIELRTCSRPSSHSTVFSIVANHSGKWRSFPSLTALKLPGQRRCEWAWRDRHGYGVEPGMMVWLEETKQEAWDVRSVGGLSCSCALSCSDFLFFSFPSLQSMNPIVPDFRTLDSNMPTTPEPTREATHMCPPHKGHLAANHVAENSTVSPTSGFKSVVRKHSP
jgi:hypothetical protein